MTADLPSAAMNSCLISVVMPCYNAGQHVEEAVRSALGQRDVAVELIVVDDGSSDDSVAVVQRLQTEFGQRLKLLHAPHAGPYPARNLGLASASGEYTAFLDADDYWEPHCLASLLAGLLERQSDLAYCGWQNVGAVTTGGQPYVPPAYEEEDTSAHFLAVCPWPIHAALLRTAVVRAVGGFSTRRFASMDYDFWLRVYAHTQRITRVPQVLAYYRWHGSGQISAIKWRQVMDAWIVRRDFVRQHPERVAHMSASQLEDLVDGALLRAAYAAFWKRDLVSAQKLFRLSLRTRAWRLRDLAHLLPSLLPLSLYRLLVSGLEKK